MERGSSLSAPNADDCDSKTDLEAVVCLHAAVAPPQMFAPDQGDNDVVSEHYWNRDA